MNLTQINATAEVMAKHKITTQNLGNLPEVLRNVVFRGTNKVLLDSLSPDQRDMWIDDIEEIKKLHDFFEDWHYQFESLEAQERERRVHDE